MIVPLRAWFVVGVIITLTACGSSPWQPAPVEERSNTKRQQQLEAWRVYRAKQQTPQSVADQKPVNKKAQPKEKSRPSVSKTTAAMDSVSPVLVPDGLAVKTKTVSPAVTRLIKQAQEANQRRQYQTALSFLQRALRINANNAEVYLLMAKQHLALNQTQQACSLAAKSRHYAIPGSRTHEDIEVLLKGCSAP